MRSSLSLSVYPIHSLNNALADHDDRPPRRSPRLLTAAPEDVNYRNRYQIRISEFFLDRQSQVTAFFVDIFVSLVLFLLRCR